MNHLLLDFGGVVAFDKMPKHCQRLADVFGCDITELNKALSEKSKDGQLIRKNLISEEVFWRRVCSTLTRSSSLRLEPVKLTEMWFSTYQIDTEFTKFLSNLDGYSVGIATNCDRYREAHLKNALDKHGISLPIYASWRFGAMKPEQTFFDGISGEIKHSLGNDKVIYVDDRIQHVQAAQKFMGAYGVKYKGLSDLKDLLTTSKVTE